MKKILILDDLPDFLDMLESYLEELGEFQIIKSLNANDALKTLYSEKFDLICTDYKMPKMNGIEFVTKVRKEMGINYNTPIIFLSGLRPDLIADAQVWERVFFLDKPFKPNQIKFTVNCALKN
jgi:CheY-like chemotaxis protein